MSFAPVDLDKVRAAVPRASASFLRLNGLIEGPKTIKASEWKPVPLAQRIETFRNAAGQPVAVPAPSVPMGKRSVGISGKKPRCSRVPRTRNAGTLTEAAFWGMLRSGLRRTFRFWKPALEALKAARVPCKGARGQKWAYLCADCNKLYPRKLVEIDHVVPCGSLRSYDDLPGFVARLTSETGFAVRCEDCHLKKTKAEREAKAGE